MADNRLSLACDAGLIDLPAAGRILVLRPPGEADLSALPAERTYIVQGFWPDAAMLINRGYAVSQHLPESGAGHAMAIVFLQRARQQSQEMIARAMAATNGGPVAVDGQKTDGVEPMLKAARARGKVSAEVISKAHGKLFVVESGDFSDWRPTGPRVGPDGLVSRPGNFAHGVIDPGSAALAAALATAPLAGRVADLGAGWGYLARAVLAHAAVTECHLVEAESEALDCARINITDERARFHWADARRHEDDTAFDHVVMNPPFHQRRAAEPALGRAFIAAAARLLAQQGTLWLVANRHLPYETELAEHFAEIAALPAPPGYKVLRCGRRPAGRQREVRRRRAEPQGEGT